MNDKRRAELTRANTMLTDTLEILEAVKDEEQESFDNLGEGLQQSERGQDMETTVAALEDAIASVESAKDEIGSYTN